MPDPKSPVSPTAGGSENLDGTSGDSRDTSTTMRLRILDMEGELWPEDQGRADSEDRAGVDPKDRATGKED